MTELIPPAAIGFLCGMLAMLAIVGVDKGDLYREIEELRRLVPKRGARGRFVKHKEAGR